MKKAGAGLAPAPGVLRRVNEVPDVAYGSETPPSSASLFLRMPVSMYFRIMAGMAVVMRSVFPLVFVLVHVRVIMNLPFVLLHMLMRVFVRMPVRM
jgi:hypothetical protein